MTALPEKRLPSMVGRADRPLTLRGVVEADLPELHRLDREAFPEEPYHYFELRQAYDVHADRFLVLDDGESLHGYVLFVTTSDGYVNWVKSLAITHDLRGRGLGRRLMLEVLRRLRAEGVHQVRLTVEPTNAAAITLYRSLGFDVEGGVHKHYFGPGEDRLIMTLGL
ncbi:GNAT family N-acetyltransferase [Streptomyces sp. NPDC057403]|uniref:GNAT family N-acetyltransferase n=1 Tax=Streptomyces sp. NPDC057403 TaxID=3346119 RepID=UPI003693DA08